MPGLRIAFAQSSEDFRLSNKTSTGIAWLLSRSVGRS